MVLPHKRVCIMIAAVFTVLTAVLLFTYKPDSEREATAKALPAALQTAFTETGAKYEKMMLRDYALIDKCSHTAAEIKKLTAMLPMALGEENELAQTEYGGEGFEGIGYSGTTKQGYALDLVVQSRKAAAETVLIAELWYDGTVDSLPEALRYLDGCFEAMGAKSDPAVVLAGTFPRLLNAKEKKQTAKKCFAVLEGKITEKAADGDYLSYSGYAPALGQGKLSADREINFQAVLYDDETVGKTKVYLGCPVVFSDY